MNCGIVKLVFKKSLLITESWITFGYACVRLWAVKDRSVHGSRFGVAFQMTV